MYGGNTTIAKAFITVCLLATAAACGTTPTPQATPMDIAAAFRADTGQDGRACIWSDRIDAFGTLVHDSVISISSRTQREYYIAVTTFSCPELGSMPVAAFEGSFSQFCGRRGDAVISHGTPCTIGSVFRYDDRSAAFESWDRVKTSLAERRTNDAETP